MKNIGKLYASLIAIFAVMVFLVGSASAAELANIDIIWVKGMPVNYSNMFAESPAIFPGETVPIKVSFVALKDAQDVRVEVEIDGYGRGLESKTERFDTFQGIRYTKNLALEIPFDLKDELHDSFTVTVKVYDNHDRSIQEFTVEAQRNAYDLKVLSIDTDGKAQAGKPFAVEVVLKDFGSRDLEDLFVTARIPALGVERRAYFKDIFALDRDCDQNDCKDDSAFGRIYLNIPANAAPGLYVLEVTASDNDGDAVASATRQIAVENTVPRETVIPVVSSKSFAPGQEAVYEVLIVNPTDGVKVYRALAESADGLTVEVDPSLMAIPAGSSRSVMVKVSAEDAGKYTFGVRIMTETGEVVDRVPLSATVVANKKGSNSATLDNTVIALTVILAIVFVVLLVVLIALLSKKPQKTEEFNESYY
jgi:hypothetical protein